MISVIITAKSEPKTIKRSVLAFAREKVEAMEVIVVAPDEETLNMSREVGEDVKIIKDLDRGKSAALNLALREARGDKIIFSDGDVEAGESAVKYLVETEGDLVSGRPMVDKERDNMFGFWQRVLFDTAHKLRLHESERGKYFPVSGYLFLAKRKGLDNFIWPEESLAEDDFLSHWAWQNGFKIVYESRAEVKVRGPENLSDWLKQKVRTLGASYQIPKEWKKGGTERSFWQEALGVVMMFTKYGDNLKEKFWLILLFLARFYAWILAFGKIKILHQKREKIWQRVESTK